METYRQRCGRRRGRSGPLASGVGDHGGGRPPKCSSRSAFGSTGRGLPAAARHAAWLSRGTRAPGGQLLWRDELYLELHRGCATTARIKSATTGPWSVCSVSSTGFQPSGTARGGRPGADWRPLLFQISTSFRTSIPGCLSRSSPSGVRPAARVLLQRIAVAGVAAGPQQRSAWWLVQLQPQPAEPLTVRLPAGSWRLEGPRCRARPDPVAAPRVPSFACGQALPRAQGRPLAPLPPSSIRLFWRPTPRTGVWPAAGDVEIGLTVCSSLGLMVAQLSGPIQWRRWWIGEFWDAWDIAADYREHPLPLTGGAPELVEQGLLCCRFLVRAAALKSGLDISGPPPVLELT